MKKRKYLTFLGIALFFFSAMIFLYLNISFRMYNENTAFQLSGITETVANNIEFVLREHRTPDVESCLESIGDLNNAYLNNPPVIRLNLYSAGKKQIYTFGMEAQLKDPVLWKELDNPEIHVENTEIFSGKKSIYHVKTIYFDNAPAAYLEVYYDQHAVVSRLFPERIPLFLTVFLINFFIVFFLVIMITGYLKRIHYYENNHPLTTTIDPLTGLLNKEEFTRQLKKELDRIERSGTDATLLTCDIDNFLDLNEKYGFDFGDLVLKNVSRIISENFRNFDILGRFGGDEVMILMIDAKEDEGVVAGERLRQSVMENKYYYESNEITVTLSFGIASTMEVRDLNTKGIGKNLSLFRTLIFNSLNALARAKRGGKNMLIRHSDLDQN